MSESRTKITAGVIVIAVLALTVALVVKNTSVKKELPAPPDVSTLKTPAEILAAEKSSSKTLVEAKDSERGERPNPEELRDALESEQAKNTDVLNKRGPDIALPTGVPSGGSGSDVLRTQKDNIQAAVIELKPKVKTCYENTLKDFPEAEGRVVVGFEIKPDDDGKEGVVEMSELDPDKTTLFDQKLHDCMLTTVAEIRVDPPASGEVLRVNYPFNFSNEKE